MSSFNAASVLELMRRIVVESEVHICRRYLEEFGFGSDDAEAVAAVASIYREPDYRLVLSYDRDIRARMYEFVFDFTNTGRRYSITESDTVGGVLRYREVSRSEYLAWQNGETSQTVRHPIRVPVMSPVPPPQIAPKPDPPKEPPKRRLRF